MLSPTAGLSGWPSPRRPPPARPARCPAGRVYKGLASTTTSCRCQTEPAVSCRSRPQLQLRARVTSGSCDDSQLSQLMKSAVPCSAAVAGLAWGLHRAGGGAEAGQGGSAEWGQTLLELGPGQQQRHSAIIIYHPCARPSLPASPPRAQQRALSATSKAFSSLLGGCAGPRHTATTTGRGHTNTPTHHRCGLCCGVYSSRGPRAPCPL